jgi:iron complex transport system ATP-binding protein
MITLSNLHYQIGQRQLLQDINLRFEKGKINLIMGANGAGKSTLIKILCKQIEPAKGEVYLGDRLLSSFSHRELARIRAVLSQHIDIAFPLRVEEVVMMGRYPHFTGKPGTNDHHACTAAIESFELTAFIGRDYTTLSGGEKQRVHFARVMAQTWYPQEGFDRYLLLDEPLTFLDIQYQYQFMEQLTRLANSGYVVVGVVHDLNLAARFADHLVLLHQGKVIAAGEPNHVLTPEHIEKAFGIRPIIQEFYGHKVIQFNIGTHKSSTDKK